MDIMTPAQYKETLRRLQQSASKGDYSQQIADWSALLSHERGMRRGFVSFWDAVDKAEKIDTDAGDSAVSAALHAYSEYRYTLKPQQVTQ